MRSVVFGPFALDLENGDLMGPEGPVKLDRQPTRLLALLVARAGATVTREEIERALWSEDVTVDFDGSIRACIRKIRRALGDRASDPRYLATETGRGYRFIGDVESVNPGGAPPTLVGRARVTEELERALDAARAGSGQIYFVSGEAGIGKTTLVAGFVSSAATRGSTVLRGMCSERLEGAEAYGPFLEAIEVLLAPGAPEAMKRLAPSWYRKLASGTAPVDRTRSQRRMYREFVALLGALAPHHPVVIFLDDLHWTDAATFDLIAYLAGRADSLRMLMLLTYRTKEREPPPFQAKLLDMKSRNRCREIELSYLAREDVSEYISERFRPNRFPEGLGDVVHEQTAGKPLFMVELLRDAVERGALILEEGTWRLARSIQDLRTGLPETLQSLIDRKLGQLEREDRELLTVAAVVGLEFPGAVVARALSRDIAEVEERLQELDREHGLILAAEEVELPDATPTLRYRFVHVQYQNALYRTLVPGRRVLVSRAVAEALGDAYGERRFEIATDLAMLFREAHEHEKAARYFLTAARKASDVFAYEECVRLVNRGLLMIAKLPEPEREGIEIELERLLVPALTATRGFAAGDLARPLERSLQLYQMAGDRERVHQTLFGLFSFRGFRGELREAGRVCQELWESAEEAGGAHRFMALWARGVSFFLVGEIDGSRGYYEKALDLYDPSVHREMSDTYALDSGVGAFAYASWAFWYAGYPARALESLSRALSYAEDSAPLSGVIARGFAAHIAYLNHSVSQCRRWAAEAAELAEEYDLRPFAAWAALHDGWAEVQFRDEELGLARLAEGLDRLESAGSMLMKTAHLALYADACRVSGQVERGFELLEEALEFSEAGERFHTPELHRLRGELQRLDGARGDAEESFRKAIALAAAPEAKARALELRAASSLARLLLSQGREAEAERVLSHDYFFLDDFDTADRVLARDMLSTLS